MRTRLAIVLAGAAAFLGGAHISGSPAAPLASAGHCSPGWKHAVIAGAPKCLRAGQFCTARHDSQYRRYGYRCTKYDPKAKRYRLTR